MKAAEEYIKQFNLYEVVPLSPEPKIYFSERIRRAINEARKAAIIECAERARAFVDSHGEWVSSEVVAVINKQSILSLINELK